MSLQLAPVADSSPRSSTGTKSAVDVAISLMIRPLHALIAESSLLFIATLLIMLFRPPDVQFYSLDRIAFLVLIFIGILRCLASKRLPEIAGPVTLPMLALVFLAFCSVWEEPYAAENWSLFAAKWLVPFILYHLAGLIFADAVSIRRFEIFALLALAYLTLIAVFFLADARSLIFPRYILDESIGMHADRARGPFLQAVANGVTLTMLGMLALDAFRRRRLRVFLRFCSWLQFPSQFWQPEHGLSGQPSSRRFSSCRL